MLENSKIPVWLSKLSPIKIGAITLGFVVISRDIMTEQTRAEQEAYMNDHNMDYLSERKRWVWLRDYKVKSPPYLDQLINNVKEDR